MNPENDIGNVEYKLKLLDLNTERIQKLATQLRYRCSQGNGQCVYFLGVEDDGTLVGLEQSEYDLTIKCIEEAVRINSYTISELTKRNLINNKYTYELLIRENNDKHYTETNVAVAGSVDAGKSTFISVLTTGRRDDARGSARLSIFNYKHEIQSGRTSSISHNIIGYNQDGKNINFLNKRPINWAELTQKSKKIVSFYDLAGHEKYLKTTVFGLTCYQPDYCLVMVSANRGVLPMTREHILLCANLDIPFCIIVTKIDMTKDTPNIIKDTYISIAKILKHSMVRKIPFKIKSEEDVINASINIHSNSIVPVFSISNTTFENIENINNFLYLTSSKKKCNYENNLVEMIVELAWTITSVGTVLGGYLKSGKISIADKLFFGPNNNQYVNVIVRSIHVKKIPVQHVNFGSFICLGLKGITKSDFKKGNVILSDKKQLILSNKFKCEVEILDAHSTNIKIGYRPIMHNSSIRSACTIIDIEDKICARNNDVDNILRAGDKAIITILIDFEKRYIKEKTNILFSDGKTKIVGKIIEIL